MKKNGWLQDPKTTDTKRFHRDDRSLDRYPKVFIDSGRPIPGQCPLLKSRSYVGLIVANNLGLRLREKGWRKVAPQWGKDADI